MTSDGIDHRDTCPSCGEPVRFLDGEGPYCGSCEWRADDKPRLATDGGTVEDDTDRDLSKWYDVECSCGWSTEVSSYGGAEREGMNHQDHSHGLDHSIQIIRQSDGKVMGP